MESIYSLIRKAQNNDKSAAEKIVHENTGLIWSIVKRFHGRADPDDLYQLGAIGLLKAIERFDFSYNVKFSTYAVPLIIGEMKRFLRDDGTIKVSRSLKELAYHAKKIQEQIQKEENREPSIFELSEKLGESKENIILALEASKEIESIYAAQNKNENNLKLIDLIYYHNDSEKTVERIILTEALAKLESKERQVIWMRYFQDRTQVDVAKEIGISQVQVSRIEKKVLQKMKTSLQ